MHGAQLSGMPGRGADSVGAIPDGGSVLLAGRPDCRSGPLQHHCGSGGNGQGPGQSERNPGPASESAFCRKLGWGLRTDRCEIRHPSFSHQGRGYQPDRGDQGGAQCPQKGHGKTAEAVFKKFRVFAEGPGPICPGTAGTHNPGKAVWRGLQRPEKEIPGVGFRGSGASGSGSAAGEGPFRTHCPGPGDRPPVPGDYGG